MVGAGTGAVIDVRTGRIPNALTGLLATGGVGLAGAGLTAVSLASSMAGLAIGFLLMLPGHLIGRTGAGDVKLFAAVGAVLGIERMGWAFCYTALTGGILAAGCALKRRRLAVTTRRVLGLLAAPQRSRAAIESSGADNRFAYGPAVAVGGALASLL